MGCCASTSNKAIPAQDTIRSSRARSPPPSFEEETVKEVLSETPIPKTLIENETKTRTPKSVFHQINEEEDNNVDDKPLPEQISEICSLRNNGELRQRVDRSPSSFRDLSFSGYSPAKRDRVVGNSPARRSEPSPGRVRMVPGRERRDAGDSSGRRSRSPASRMDAEQMSGMGRSTFIKKAAMSPGRVRSEVPESSRNVEETNREVNKWPPTSNESLENPLVSLECFIFL